MTAWPRPTGAAVLAVALAGIAVKRRCDGPRPTWGQVLRVRGTYWLPVDDQVLHRFRVEGARDDVASLDLEDLLASVQVVSTACPV